MKKNRLLALALASALTLGLLAGWSNENMGPAVWVMSLIVIVLGLREGRRAKPWMITGNIACLTGCVFCIAAPGNFVRSLQAEEAGIRAAEKISSSNATSNVDEKNH